MRKPLRIRLAETKTPAEIEAMIQEVSNDPDSKIGATGVDIYNKQASKKMDEMTWAIYYIRQSERKEEYVRKVSPPEMKNW